MKTTTLRAPLALVSLSIAAMAIVASCAPAPGSASSTTMPNYRHVGRMSGVLILAADDPARGVTCYMAHNSTAGGNGLSCVRTAEVRP